MTDSMDLSLDRRWSGKSRPSTKGEVPSHRTTPPSLQGAWMATDLMVYGAVTSPLPTIGKVTGSVKRKYGRHNAVCISKNVRARWRSSARTTTPIPSPVALTFFI